MPLVYLDILPQIKAVILDVDGVLSDGSITLMPDGQQVRRMNIKDGYALQLAVKKGLKIAIISGGKSEEVRKRLAGLGISDIFLGVHDKLQVYKDYLAENFLTADDCLYMGDDIPDYEVMLRVALACCPQDAAQEIKEICKYISPINGGKGCVRDILEKTLRAQNKWFDPDKTKQEFNDFLW
jgi:3-deoxy-D-manno-octulosonate 8-phosphate phosphatase (KDO 8-P phosphatase)